MTQDNFAQAYAFVFAREGGYVNNPADRGGPTNYGITHKTLAAWRGKPVSATDVRNLTKIEAREIYRKNYWDAYGLGDLPRLIAVTLFDSLTNHRPRPAVRLVQSAVNQLQEQERLKEDGILGPATRACLDMFGRSDHQLVLCDTALDNRTILYHRIVAGTPSQRQFLEGWLNRVSELRLYLRHIMTRGA